MGDAGGVSEEDVRPAELVFMYRYPGLGRDGGEELDERAKSPES